MSLLNYRWRLEQMQTMASDAIEYTKALTQNILIDTGFNSPYRLLLEAQIYVYNKFIIRLSEAERELQLIFFRLLGFVAKPSVRSTVTLKFEIFEVREVNTYFRKGFPVRATNGIIFATDNVLTINAGTTIAYVTATATRAGEDGNLPPNTINQGLQVIDVPYRVNNESSSSGGKRGQNIEDLQFEVGAFIRGQGLINVESFDRFIKEIDRRLISSVFSDTPNVVEIYIGNELGDPLPSSLIQNVQGSINVNKPLGLADILVNQFEILEVYVSVLGGISTPFDAPIVDEEISRFLKTWLYPGNPRQKDENVRGLILLEDLKRIINNSRIDYIADVKIGINEETAYGQNFAYDYKRQRVKLKTLQIVLIKGDFRYEKTHIL